MTFNRATELLSQLRSGSLFLGPSYEDLSQSISANAQGDQRSSIRGYAALEGAAIEPDELLPVRRILDEARTPLAGEILPPTKSPSRVRSFCLRLRLWTIITLLSLLFFSWFIRYLFYSRSQTFSFDLAHKNQMTPASIRTLTFPPTPLSSEESTNWIQKHWPTKRGDTEMIKFVRDPVGGTGEIVIEVGYPEGSYSGGKKGGVSSLPLGVFGHKKPQRAMVSYDIAFERGFDFVKGGKLPGLFGGENSEHCSGGQHSSACFNLRLMWRSEGMGEVYAYIPTYSSFCDDTSTTLCHSEFGTSLNRGSFNLTKGSWQTVTEVAMLNSRTDRANGVLAIYLDDWEMFWRDDIVFRVNDTVKFSLFTFSTFFGGSSEDYASKGGRAYFKNFQFFGGEEPSSAWGWRVSPEVGRP